MPTDKELTIRIPWGYWTELKRLADINIISPSELASQFLCQSMVNCMKAGVTQIHDVNKKFEEKPNANL